MFRLSSSITRVITFALISSTAFADIVFLKNGEKVEGKILRETDQQLVMEVKVTATIMDERVIAKTEVERVEKINPETEAYRAILNLQPPASSMASAQYDVPIQALQSYIRQYPNSVHTPDAQKTLKDFQADKQRVDAGEVKLQGQWLSKEEVEKEKVQIGGRIAFEYMKAQSAAGDHIGALNTFVTLEKNYSGAAVLPDAIDLAKRLAAGIKPALDRAIPEQKILKANKEAGFKSAGPVERAEMQKAYKAEMDAAEDTAEAAQKAGLYPPFIVTNEKALKTLATQLDKEQKRMAGLPVDNMRKSVQLASDAKKSLDTENIDEAAEALKEATKLWPKNELAVRLNKTVTEQKAAAAKAAAEEKKADAAVPAPKSTPSGQKPKSTPAKRPAAAVATPAPEESRPFLLSLPGAISVVVGIAVVLAGVNVFKKMKARKAAQDVEVL